MTLVSGSYYAFLAITVLIYYVLPKKFQWCVLLAASLGFFCFAGTPWTMVYLLCGIGVTWFAGKRIQADKQLHDGRPGKVGLTWLIVALAADLGMLAALKYMNFFLDNLGMVAGLLTHHPRHWSVDWPAALGISFYTLQIVGYLLDCYWDVTQAQTNLGKFALFSCFFPQMISGPINRYGKLGSQLEAEHRFEWKNLRYGVMRIIVGIFKKVAVAENFGILASTILNLENGCDGLLLMSGMLAYVIQIYSDFAGCMDIVLGSAQCFGISLTENFNAPFKSKSIQEFWQRWHITLGLWLKDYVMYPLLRTKCWSTMAKIIKKKWGKRASRKIPTHLAMLVLWFCMGLWHGGGWNYILEGIWFWGVIVAGEWMDPLFDKFRAKVKPTNRVWVLFQRCRTILIYTIGAMFFRFTNVADVFRVLWRAVYPVNFVVGLGRLGNSINNLRYEKDFTGALLASILMFIVFLILCHVERKHRSVAEGLRGKPLLFCIMVPMLLLYLALLFGIYGSGYDASMFIYGGF